MKLDEVVQIGAKDWDAFMLAHDGSFLQSWGWRDFQTALGRVVEMRRLTDPRDGSIAAQFLTIKLPLPFRQRYLYVPRGPVIRPGETAASGLAWFVDMTKGHAREIDATFARVEPPAAIGMDAVISPDGLAKRGFRPGPAMQPEHTVINDLLPNEATQLAAMHSKTRYNIRVAERHGVTVREAVYDAPWIEAEFEKFWALLSGTAERDAFSTHERGYYRTLLETLAPGRSDGTLRVRLWFAEHEGAPIAAALVAEYGATATYLHGASAHDKRQLMAPYLLHWSIMRAAKTAGIRKYDFWGVAPSDDPKHPWAGITRFKTGFGGQPAAYAGAWELPGNLFWYTLYRYAKKFRRS